jgi:hypothetical protein
MARSTALGHRDAIGADHRDEHQVPHRGPLGGPDQTSGLVVVTLGTPRAMHDDLGPGHRGFDPLVRAQLAGHELDAAAVLAAAPAGHPDPAGRLLQARDDEPPERPGAPGDQDG